MNLINIINVIYGIGMVLLLFNLTIVVHEYGHFLLARWRGLKVETFAIWFGPALWKRKIGDVEYVLGCIPLGGYVKLPQLQPDDLIEGKSQIPSDKLPYARPIDRIPTLFAGSAFNFLFAIVIACVLWVVGIPVPKWVTDTTVGYVPADSVEARAEIQPGDKIVAINGKKVSDWMEIKNDVALSLSSSVSVSLLRSSKTETVQLLPSRNNIFGIRQLEVDPILSPVVKRVIPNSPSSIAGLQPDDKIISFVGEKILSGQHLIKLVSNRVGQACPLVVDRNGKLITLTITPELNPTTQKGYIGSELTYSDSETILLKQNPIQQITDVVLQMAQVINALFHHKETGIGVADFSGPIGIIDMLYQAVTKDIRLALKFLILLNVNLAIINLLPLPVLDGGHIVFTLLEWIRKKPLHPKIMEVLQTAFLVLLLGFILYVSFNDVKRKFYGWFPKDVKTQNSTPAEAQKPGK